MTFTDNNNADWCQRDTYLFSTEKTRSVCIYINAGRNRVSIHCDIPLNLSVCLLSKIARDLHSMQ